MDGGSIAGPPTRRGKPRDASTISSSRNEPITDSVVAASADGQTILTSSDARPPVLRHAPSYEGVPLLAPPVTAAVFCHDDQAIVTGHADRRLRLWTAKSGQFRAISPK